MGKEAKYLPKGISHTRKILQGTTWKLVLKSELVVSLLQLKFDAVLQIMQGPAVPWSAAVEQLVRQHLEMNHGK